MGSVPSQAQLNKHLHGKEHMKKETRATIEHQDLEDCKKIIDLLEQRLQENERELQVCRNLHAMDKQQLVESVAHCQRNHMTRTVPTPLPPFNETFKGKKETSCPCSEGEDFKGKKEVPTSWPTEMAFDGKTETPAWPNEAEASAVIISTDSNHPAFLGARPKDLPIAYNYTKYGAKPTGL